MVKTPAIRIAYTCSRGEVIWRPSASDVRAGEPRPGRRASPRVSPPAKAAPANSMATNSRPLPRNTDPEEPVLQLPYPVPHDADEPQEGDTGEWHQVQRDSDGTTARRIGQPCAGLSGMAGDETDERTRTRMSSSEKMIPATAAARGVRRPMPVIGSSWSMIQQASSKGELRTCWARRSYAKPKSAHHRGSRGQDNYQQKKTAGRAWNLARRSSPRYRGSERNRHARRDYAEDDGNPPSPGARAG